MTSLWLTCWLGCSGPTISDRVLSALPKAELQEATAFVDYIKVFPLTRWEEGAFKGREGQHLKYRLFAPLNSEEGKDYPMIVFLHDSQGSGLKNTRQLQNGNAAPASAWTLPRVQNDHPTWVLAPQCGPGRTWTGEREVEVPEGTPEPAPCIEPVPELIDHLLVTSEVDRRRVYLVGSAMGADGATELLAKYPQLFAATVLITHDPANKFRESVIGNRIEALAQEPLWQFHGSNVSDDTDARALVDRMRAAGGQNSVYWRYEGGMARVRTFREPALLDWVFSQTQKR